MSNSCYSNNAKDTPLEHGTASFEKASDIYLNSVFDRTAVIASSFADILTHMGIAYKDDPQTKDTPERFARMLMEVCSGRYEDPPEITTFPNADPNPNISIGIDEMIVVGPIKIYSLCSHHFVPFIGNVYIGYIPREKVAGLSKFARVAKYFSARPQIQEVLTTQIYDYLMEKLEASYLAVFIDAVHFCSYWRGVKDTATMSTSKLSPAFKTASRAELMTIINNRRKPVVD